MKSTSGFDRLHCKQNSVTRVSLRNALNFIWILMVSLLAGCASSGSKVQSLCQLDFKAQRCWKSKSKNQGPTFSEMEMWQEGGDRFYSIDHVDLEKIVKALGK